MTIDFVIRPATLKRMIADADALTLSNKTIAVRIAASPLIVPFSATETSGGYRLSKSVSGHLCPSVEVRIPGTALRLVPTAFAIARPA